MASLKTKLWLVYLPFLLIAIATIAGYGLFRWFFDIKLGVLPLKEDVLNIWIPFMLPYIPVLIWMRRRIRILNVRGKNDNGYFFYTLIMAAAITIPMIISQEFLIRASFDLIEVDEAGEVEAFPKDRYFEINSFSVDEWSNTSSIDARVYGRNNDELRFFLYIALPFDSAQNTWYGIVFSENTTNFSNKEQKKAEFEEFIAGAQEEFDNYDFQDVVYFEKLGYSDQRDSYLEAIREKNPDINESDQIILVPQHSALNQDISGFWTDFGTACGIAGFVILLMVIIPGINKRELQNFYNKRPILDDDLITFMEMISPWGPTPGTAILALAQLGVFIAMVLAGINMVSPSGRELLEFGANRRSEVLDGQYWRLVTCIFIHSGVMHLLMNLFGLFVGAALLEDILKKYRLVFTFLITGIIASITSIAFHVNTISVGASGAVFGLYGVILAFTAFKIYPKETRRLSWSLLGLYAGVSLLFGFLGGIDNAAHFGGLISGFLVGGIYILTGRDKLVSRAAGHYKV